MSNYFAPCFRIDINGSRLAADISQNIQDLQIVSSADTVDTFTFTVVNTLPDMRWTHSDDADLFKEGNAVVIWVGYMGEMQIMISGEITKVSPVFPDSGVPTVGIEGNTLLHRMQGDCKTRTFQKMTDKQIVEQIAKEAGLQAVADETNIQHDYLMQPNKSDLEFLRQRAKALNFELLIEGSKLIFRKTKEDSSHSYTLLWAQTQMGFTLDRVFPMKSFSLQLDAKKAPSSVTYKSYDPSTKQVMTSRADSSDQDSKMGGTTTGADIYSGSFHRTREYVHVTTPFPNQAAQDQHCKATFNEKAMGTVSGSAETMGLPDLRSGKIVTLLGVGDRYEGEYKITDATHSISESGYSTSINVQRNATS